MKRRNYKVRFVRAQEGELFEVPKDEKWRFAGVGTKAEGGNDWLIFIAWQITEGEMAGIVWNCS